MAHLREMQVFTNTANAGCIVPLCARHCGLERESGYRQWFGQAAVRVAGREKMREGLAREGASQRGLRGLAEGWDFQQAPVP